MPTAATSALNSCPGGSLAQPSTTSYRNSPVPRIMPSRGSEIVGEVLVRRDGPAREPEPERLGREHLDLPSILLEAVRMEVLAHHGGGVLELGFQPWRRVREAALRGAEAIVGGAEGLGEAPGDPAVGLPDLAPQHDEVLRRKRAGPPEVVLLDLAEVGEQPGERAVARMVGDRARRAVDRLQLTSDEHVRQRAARRR